MVDNCTMKWLILALAVAFNASASIFVKLAVQSPRQMPTINNIFSWFSSGPLWLGLFCYGLAFIMYTIVLSKMPLNVAYPILTVGAIAVVAVASVIIFDEKFSYFAMAGTMLIIAGVIMIMQKA